MTREHDDHEPRITLPYFLQECEAVHARHLQIDEGRMDSHLFQKSKGVLTTASSMYMVVFLEKDSLEGRQDCRLIIYH